MKSHYRLGRKEGRGREREREREREDEEEINMTKKERGWGVITKQ